MDVENGRVPTRSRAQEDNPEQISALVQEKDRLRVWIERDRAPKTKREKGRKKKRKREGKKERERKQDGSRMSESLATIQMALGSLHDRFEIAAGVILPRASESERP